MNLRIAAACRLIELDRDPSDQPRRPLFGQKTHRLIIRGGTPHFEYIAGSVTDISSAPPLLAGTGKDQVHLLVTCTVHTMANSNAAYHAAGN